MTEKKFTPKALKNFQYLSVSDMHPDGHKTAYVKTKADEETGLFIPHIFEVDHDTMEEREAIKTTTGEKRPLYSPDGQKLAYLSNQSGEYQIYIRQDGEEKARKLTSLRHGITYYNWSKDGKKLVFTAPLWQKEIDGDCSFVEMELSEREAWLEAKALEPIEIDEIDYKKDCCFGVCDGSVSQIGIVDLDSGEQYLLTTGAMGCEYPDFSKDNQLITFLGKPNKGSRASVLELFICDCNGENIRQLSFDNKLSLRPVQSPVFSGDGDSIYINGYQSFEESGYIETIYQISVEDGTARSLFEEKDETITFGVSGMPISRTILGEESPIFRIDYDSNILYFRNAWMGWENLYGMHLDSSGAIEQVFSKEWNVHGFCLPRNNQMVFLGGNLDVVSELCILEISTHTIRKITCSNAWLEEYSLAKTETHLIDSKDKKAKLQVWISYSNQGTLSKKPIVLYIHGGPECTYVSDFWHESQAIASSGMICVYTNPRGSLGYGPDFNKDDYAWGKEAMDDLLSAVDFVISQGIGDPERIGVTGGSYGGYMTNKLIMTSKRFKAAATQRCLVNTATSYGTGDIGFISNRVSDLSKVKMLDFLEKRARNTLLKDVDNIKIPLLLLHGYKDLRCSFEQSEQLFVAMKERHPEIPAKLVMFPDENHEITRTGKLHNQIRHLEEIIEWFNIYLKEEGERDD